MLNYYKQYSRRTRIQDIANTFSGGVEYTDRPVDAGMSKLLVNFDVSTSGNLLRPRKGYEITKELDLPDVYAIVGHKAYNKAEYVYFVKEVRVEQTEDYVYHLYKINLNSEEAKAELVSADNADETEATPIALDYIEKLGYNIHDTKSKGYKHWYIIEAFDGLYFRDTEGNYYVDKPFSNNVDGDTISEEAQYRCVKVEPYKPNPAEVNVSSGAASYNALLGADMYRFYDSRTAIMSNSCNISPLGLIAYEDEACKTPMLYHEPGKKIYYRIYYNFAKSYTGCTRVTVYMKSTKDNTFTKAHEVIKNASGWDALPPIIYSSSFQGESVVFKIEAMNCSTDGVDVKQDTIDNTVVYFSPRTIMSTVNIEKLTNKSNFNLGAKTYSLNKAKGMTYWSNRIILWDVPEDNTVLFTSFVNNTKWFPYPTGIDTFEDKIIKAVPLLDTLLVFTKSNIYTLVANADGLGFTRSIIQRNLKITEDEAHLIIPYKNMVFFKSGNYFYMVVPSVSSTSVGLTIAPISKPIEEFFNNFSESIEKLLKTLYNIDIIEKYPIVLQSVKSYIDYDEIIIDYIYQIHVSNTDNKYTPCLLSIKLMYNTTNRTWRFYLVEVNSNKIIPYFENAVTRLNYLDIKDNKLILIESSKDSCKDTQATGVLLNYQLLDTGYHNVSGDKYPNVKKRFRELQLVLDNPSYRHLSFYTEFAIDGYVRRDRVKYQCISKTFTDGKNYLVYEAVPYMPEHYFAEVNSTTILAEDEKDINAWTLDVSEFPEQIAYKIRLPFTGKGYFPSLILTNYDQENYELLSYVWVYRIMNAR